MPRTALINRLRAADAVPLVTLVAPAGYGKTTTLAQWSAREPRPVAWVSVDEHDDEPLALLRAVAAALNACEPLAQSVLRALRSDTESIWTSALPQLAAAMASLEAPCAVVLDCASSLSSKGSVEVASALAQHVPRGSTLVLAGRSQLPLPMAALRARGQTLEIGPELLALTRREAESLLKASGVELTSEQVDELVDRTEGWAAGLYLAALAIRDGGERDPAAFGGDDRYLGDFFRSECLATLSPEQRDFLRRTSILRRMSGPLTDTVLETSGSSSVLQGLEDANLFLVPLDRSRSCYRYHHLFGDLLRRELEQREPELVLDLHRRAAAWFETHGDADAAVTHAVEGHDMERVARIVEGKGLRECEAGGIAAVESWLSRFEVADLGRHPDVALLGSWIHALRGRPAEADHWFSLAETGVDVPSRGLIRAALCPDGIPQMRSDATTAVAGLSATAPTRPIAVFLLGVAQGLLGDVETGEETLARAVEESAAHHAADTGAAALIQLALLAAARGDTDASSRIALEARERADDRGRRETALSALLAAVSARALLRHGRWSDARAELERVDGLAPTLTQALPWLAVQTWIEAAWAKLALHNVDGASAFAVEADVILRKRPDLGALCEQRDVLQQELEAQRTSPQGRESGLTSAELRLLPLLATHLIYREIGQRLYVSRNTVKTQAISVFRKLGVSSRSEAVDRAVALGLLADTPASPRPPTSEKAA